MKAVILTGGLGTRISEETSIRPKPMIEVGGRAMLRHVMKDSSARGVNECGRCNMTMPYKVEVCRREKAGWIRIKAKRLLATGCRMLDRCLDFSVLKRIGVRRKTELGKAQKLLGLSKRFN